MRHISVMGVFILSMLGTAQKPDGSAALNLPPLMKGGFASLWYREHKFVSKEYGDFELLNFDNINHPIEKAKITATTWSLCAMGNFLGTKEVQFATLARVKGRGDGCLMLMFEWVDPADTTRPHGVFYRTFIGKKHLLIRTKQAATGGVDTLEFSCADLNRLCGKAYLDAASNAMRLTVVANE